MFAGQYCYQTNRQFQYQFQYHKQYEVALLRNNRLMLIPLNRATYVYFNSSDMLHYCFLIMGILG